MLGKVNLTATRACQETRSTHSVAALTLLAFRDGRPLDLLGSVDECLVRRNLELPWTIGAPVGLAHPAYRRVSY